MVYLKTEFNKCAKEWLSPHGFIKMKGIPYFGRLINGEILQVITAISSSSLIRGKKAFTIRTCMITVYSGFFGERSFEIFGCNIIRFGRADNIDHHELNRYFQERYKDLYEFDTFYYDDETLREVMEMVLEDVCRLIVPRFDRVRTLEDYVEYCKWKQPAIIARADEFYKDSLLLIKTNNHETFEDMLEYWREYALERYGDTNNPHYQSYMEDKYNYYLESYIKPRDKIYADPDLYARAMEELDKRKAENTEKLRKYGFTV